MMKEKKTIPKRVRGTVLFTVVSVMMVMVVFLAATLALATTANRRAYTNYQQEQMEYTARAVLDSVMEQVRVDASTDGLGICEYITGISPGSTQEFDVTITSASGEAEVHNVLVTNMDDSRSIYDDGAGMFTPLNIYQLSVTVASDTTNASATYDSYIGLMREWVDDPSSPTPTPPVSNNGGAFVSLGDTAGTEIAVHGYTTGGTYLGIGIMPRQYQLGSNEMTIDAPFYVNGALDVPNKLFMHFTKPDDFMVVKGDLRVTMNDMYTKFAGYSDTGANYENTPYIYVDGKFSANNYIELGEPDHPVNFYLGSIDLSSGTGTKKLYGDIYLMDEDKESVFGSSGIDTHLYKWTSGTFTRSDAKSTYNTSYGNIFSMGSIKYTGKEQSVEGNIQVKGDLTVECNPLTVNGDIYVDGKLTVTSNLICTGNIYVGELSNSGSINCNGSINVANAAGAAAGNLNGKAVTEIAGLAPVETTVEYQVYYTQYGQDTGLPEITVHTAADRPGWYQPDQVSVDARYRVHKINLADGTETFEDFADPWNMKELISMTSYDVAAYPAGPEDFLRATYPEYLALRTATTPGTAMVIPETSLAYDLDDVIGREVYPSDYTRANLLTNKIEDPTIVDYESMYPSSVDDLDSAVFNGGRYQLSIYGGGGTEYPSTQAPGNMSDLQEGSHYLINTDCVLTGYWDKNIYIDGSSGSRTVILDNFNLSIDKSIIIDDANPVTLVVVGNVNLSQRCYVMTTDYLNMLAPGWNMDNNLAGYMTQGATIPQIVSNITDPTYPNVSIYSVPPNTSDPDAMSKLELDMNCVVTALVRAPKMIYKASGGYENIGQLNYVLPSGNTVKYGNNADIDPANNKTIGLIGQLIAGSIQLQANSKWGMLYVREPDGGTPPAPPAPGPGPGPTPSGGYWVTTFRTLYTNTY